MIDSILFIGFGGPTEPAHIMPFLRTVVFGRGVPEERLLDVELATSELQRPQMALGTLQQAGLHRRAER